MTATIDKDVLIDQLKTFGLDENYIRNFLENLPSHDAASSPAEHDSLDTSVNNLVRIEFGVDGHPGGPRAVYIVNLRSASTNVTYARTVISPQGNTYRNTVTLSSKQKYYVGATCNTAWATDLCAEEIVTTIERAW